MNTNSQDTIFIGYDPGMGNQKVYGKEGGAIVPSHVALKSQNAIATFKNATPQKQLSFTDYDSNVGNLLPTCQQDVMRCVILY